MCAPALPPLQMTGIDRSFKRLREIRDRGMAVGLFDDKRLHWQK